MPVTLAGMENVRAFLEERGREVKYHIFIKNIFAFSACRAAAKGRSGNSCWMIPMVADTLISKEASTANLLKIKIKPV